jgi:hypothetical protein
MFFPSPPPPFPLREPFSLLTQQTNREKSRAYEGAKTRRGWNGLERMGLKRAIK